MARLRVFRNLHAITLLLLSIVPSNLCLLPANIHPSSSPPSPIRTATFSWFSTFVLPLNLCPFAHRPLLTHPSELRYVQHTGPEKFALLQTLVAESSRLADLNGKSSRLTSLVVLEPPYPPGLATFEGFIEFVNDEVSRLPAVEEGSVQCAPFHPDFRFAREPCDGLASNSDFDAGDFVNRSPYPMLHLLRETEVAVAVAGYEARRGEMEGVWLRNRELMARFGLGEAEEARRTGVLPKAAKDFLEKERRGGGSIDSG